ncbi:MAG: TIGR00266 family protein [Candidatus Helarchaeota archaeon]|nr:TIGR00266 family protein [Candidatus Helarchaeota archaeon]
MQDGVHYKYEILFAPSYSIVNILLKEGQTINAEAGVMIYHDTTIGIHTKKAAKGFWASVKRTFAGETFFINEFTAETGDGILGLAPPYPGDIKHLKLKAGEEWMVYSGGFVASSPTLDTGTKFSGFKRGIFGGEKMFFLLAKAEEDSDLFVSALGGFLERELEPEEKLRIDNSHLVAMESSLKWDIKKVGGLKSTLFSKEGLVIEATGPGRVIFQTRSPSEVISWIWRSLPHKHTG